MARQKGFPRSLIEKIVPYQTIIRIVQGKIQRTGLVVRARTSGIEYVWFNSDEELCSGHASARRWWIKALSESDIEPGLRLRYYLNLEIIPKLWDIDTDWEDDQQRIRDLFTIEERERLTLEAKDGEMRLRAWLSLLENASAGREVFFRLLENPALFLGEILSTDQIDPALEDLEKNGWLQDVIQDEKIAPVNRVFALEYARAITPEGEIDPALTIFPNLPRGIQVEYLEYAIFRAKHHGMSFWEDEVHIRLLVIAGYLPAHRTNSLEELEAVSNHLRELFQDDDQFNILIAALPSILRGETAPWISVDGPVGHLARFYEELFASDSKKF